MTALTARSVADQAPVPVRLLVVVAACGSVFPLLAWVYGLGSFATWGAGVGLPLVLAVTGFAAVLTRTGRWPATRRAVRAGALGGLLGTLGYDLFRVPFVHLLGLGLLAPIDSYGVLLLDASSSSAWTGLAGWGYHTANGVGFGVAYAVLLRGRHWGCGLAWAMLLETATVVSPFATTYALRGPDGVHWLPIALAYAAHVPYGIAVGKAGQHADLVDARAREVVRSPVAVALAAVVVGLVVWHAPLSPDARVQTGRDVADGASAVIVRDRFFPQWLRVPPGGCVVVRNDDGVLHRLAGGTPVEPGETVQECFPDAGVRRVKVDDAPFSGGYVIVDEELP